MRALLVGDYHAVSDELGECRALLDLVCDTAKTHQVDQIVLLGDQYHSFATINVYVQAFWVEAFAKLQAIAQTIAIVGNHDQPGDNTEIISNHALKVHSDTIYVIDRPQVIGSVLYLPYYSKESIWRDRVDNIDKSLYHTIVTHQSFNGYTYENGMAITDGYDLKGINVPVISGHIHKTQGGVDSPLWYPGSPRWRYLSDANEDKAIYVVEFPDNVAPEGYLKGRRGVVERVSTQGACSPIHHLEITPGGPWPSFKPNARTTVDIRGPEAFVNEVLPRIKSKAHRIRVTIDNPKQIVVSTQKGLKESLRDFTNKLPAPNGTEPAVLYQEIANRIATDAD